jgi:hypothetical protein
MSELPLLSEFRSPVEQQYSSCSLHTRRHLEEATVDLEVWAWPLLLASEDVVDR